MNSEDSPTAWPDLTRTKVALDAFDESGGAPEAVGEAFALDTADRNDPETARRVRPGKKLPANHPDEPFVRRLVRVWLEMRSREL